VAAATRVGHLYHLTCQSSRQQAYMAKNDITEELWHRRYGHLGARDLKKLAAEEMVVSLNYDTSKDMGFCEPCVEGKHHRTTFPTSGGKRCDKVLGLVHSDVCGKIGTQSLSGSQYFLTFIDDKTRYTWIYVLKHKSQVFEKFIEWKALVEKSTGQKLSLSNGQWW